MKKDKVLIAVDSGEYNLKVAKEGIAFAMKIHAQPAFIFVVDTSKAIGNVDAGITPGEALIVLKKEAEMMLDEFGKDYPEGDFMKFMPEGRPPREIIKTAIDWKADYVVIGKKGKSGLIRILLGSVADYVVKHSEVPVMIIPV